MESDPHWHRAVPAARSRAMDSRRPDPKSQKHNLACTVCGYGIARRLPPERCPMCQSRGTWSHSAWRPFSARV